MINITSKNLLELIRAYFASLGLGREAEEHFTARNFTDALVLQLPAVCLVPGNKPDTSSSHQTHIHVTGENRTFFFPKSQVDAADKSTDDYRQDVIVSEQNVKALGGEQIDTPGLQLRQTYTMTKITCRDGQAAQVQVSKLRHDGGLFIGLRNGLYEDDLLVFLRSRTDNALTAVGIPRSFYEGRYELKDGLFTGLESKGSITVKRALSDVMDEYKDSDLLRSDDAITDAVYQELVSDAPLIETEYAPEEYHAPADREKTAGSSRPPTDPSLGKEALHRGHYQCAVDPAHATFLKKDGTPYMEVHHLIPLEWQSQFTCKLDTRANLVLLCPLCHRLLHHGRIEDIISILTKLYSERQAALAASGLHLTLDELIQFYR